MSKRNHNHTGKPLINPWGLLTAAGTVACAATVLGFLGALSWVFDLLSHFRSQYFIGLLAIALILLIRRNLKDCLLLAIFAGINLFLIVPLYLPRPRANIDNGQVIRAMLFNINTHNRHTEKVIKSLRDWNPDILVLEEINQQWLDDLSPIITNWPYSCVDPREDNFGIGLFSKFPLAEAQILYIGQIEIPSIIAKASIGRTNLSILATHPLPPAGATYSYGRNDQLQMIPVFTRKLSEPLILLGDLNVTPWNHYFRKLLKESGLKDSAEGFGIQPTWPSINPLMRIPIDHCLHSTNVHIINRQIGSATGSDHYPLIIDFSLYDRN